MSDTHHSLFLAAYRANGEINLHDLDALTPEDKTSLKMVVCGNVVCGNVVEKDEAKQFIWESKPDEFLIKYGEEDCFIILKEKFGNVTDTSMEYHSDHEGFYPSCFQV